jgi:hypothetical protein
MAELSRMNMSLLFIAFALLVMVAGILYRRRLSALRDRDTTQLTDDMVRRIEERGWLEAEEPLDWEEIREEEERFWKESWDEPDDEW